jgi:hypothetical protein
METHNRYPHCKSQTQTIKYPNRTNKNNVDIIKHLSKDKKYNDDYEKWFSGINYQSKTKNKIKIGGRLHIELGTKFILQHIVNYTKNDMGDTIDYSYNYQDILFKDVDSIDWENYFLETEIIYNNINKENESINENNKKIIEYNNEVDEVIKNINLLERWEQYIVFEGIKYGIPCVYKNIHRENNCFGSITEDYSERCNCHCCEHWGGCSNTTGTQYYKCKKCDYKYGESKNYSKNYKGQ